MINIMDMLELCMAIYGVIGLIVKMTPTLAKESAILRLIKILGKLTNRQTDDKKLRAAKRKSKANKNLI